MKMKLWLGIISAVFLFATTAAAVLAQETETPPPPYTGLENPFSWDDTEAQAAGKGMYGMFCLSCHGVKGDELWPSETPTPTSLENAADYYFWVLSEGRLDRVPAEGGEKGMSTYKDSLSEEQRWQVLTYVWSLVGAVPAVEAPVEAAAEAAAPAPEVIEIPPSLTLTVGDIASPDQRGQVGEPLTFTAVLEDGQGDPITGETVKFLLGVNFLTLADGLMEIGEAVTDEQGAAHVRYTPRFSGAVQVIAKYRARSGLLETASALTLAEATAPFYHTEAGIKLPVLGPEIVIGPASSQQLGEMGTAPGMAFRLPGGTFSWLLLPTIAVMIVWFTYFRVMCQMLRIPIVGKTDTNTRLIPMVGIVMVLGLGTMLLLVLLTGAYSHWHLAH
jgi:mono/diheme cytochrome c family protein